MSAGGWRAGLSLDALSYFVSTASFLLMVPRRFVEVPAAQHAGTMRGAIARESRRFPRELAEGWHAVRTSRPLLFTLLSLFLVVSLGGIVITSGVVYIERVSGDVARGLGFLAGALSFGMIFGSPLSHLVGRRMGERRILSLALALSGGAVVLFSRAHTYELMLAVFFVGGIFLAPVVIATETLQQQYCPPALRGRVFAMRDFANRLGFLALALPGGLLASRLPLEDVLAGAGALLAAAGIAMALLWRRETP